MRYEIHAASDPAQAADPGQPALATVLDPLYLPRTRWRQDGPNYWAIHAIHSVTGERLVGPVWRFDTLPADAPYDSVLAPFMDFTWVQRTTPLATYGFDSTDSKRLLASITDGTLDYVRIWYEQKQYPVGRYGVTDSEPLNGFDYLYAVTSIAETRTPFAGFERVDRFESPLAWDFQQRVVPRVESRADASQVWVVPNPFRAKADWDRAPAYGDRLTRHLDFMGLPRARCTIQVWTLAGDLVTTIDHDGTQGSGQAPWNLVSRNGQEVASGVYLFTVQSSLGSSRGRFVVIR